MRVLRRLQIEKRALQEIENERQKKIEREKRVRKMIAQRLKMVRDLVPLYEKKGFDPMMIVFGVLAVLFVLHVVSLVYFNWESITTTTMSVVNPVVDWSLWTYENAKHYGFAAYEFALDQYAKFFPSTD
jgi:hypothetical protein